jgi:hypothetical protein
MDGKRSGIVHDVQFIGVRDFAGTPVSVKARFLREKCGEKDFLKKLLHCWVSFTTLTALSQERVSRQRNRKFSAKTLDSFWCGEYLYPLTENGQSSFGVNLERRNLLREGSKRQLAVSSQSND